MELFPYFHTINRQELQQYHDIVFVDPNLWDTLYFMHINSSRNSWQILRYMSMSRRRHLGMNIVRDRRERFIKHQDNVDEIRAVEQRLTQTNSHSTSTMDFDRYMSVRGETANVLGPLYENAIFRRVQCWTSIGKQRNFSLLGNLIRCKFGSNPLIIVRDKVCANCRSLPRTNPRDRVMVSIISTWVLRPLVGRVSYIFIMSRLSRKYNENKYQTRQPPSLATSITCGNLRTWAVGVSKYAVQVGVYGQWKKWNRDLMAVCNFRQIWDAYLNGRERPNDLKVQPRNRDGDDVVGGVGNA